MDNNKRQRLEKAGWQVGTVAEFIELSPNELEMVALKLALSRQFNPLLIRVIMILLHQEWLIKRDR